MYGDGTPSNEKVIIREQKGKVAYLTFNRPEKLNVFNRQLLDEMLENLDAMRDDESISVVILRGAGRAFSAGFDVDASDPERKKQHTVVSDWQRLEKNMNIFLKFWEYPKPVIAQVHGYCLGGATQLCVCCDIVIAAENASFGFPSLPLGGGFVGPMWVWRVGTQRAKMMDLVAGSKISGLEAERWGFVAKTYPEEQLEEQVLKLARGIAKTPLDMLTMKKLAINRIADVQGFKTAVMFGPEWDAILHFADGCLTTKKMISELGVKGAIKWFNEQEV